MMISNLQPPFDPSVDALLPLREGLFGVVSQVDLTPELLECVWYILRTPSGLQYIQSRAGLLHRRLLKSTRKQLVDHRNHNGLDNRRCNIRPSTYSLNAANARPPRQGASRFKGVTFDRSRNLWLARLYQGKKRTLFRQRFASEVEAARAYDFAALEHFGEHTLLNLPDSALLFAKARPELVEVES
jgi:hypothetical protein